MVASHQKLDSEPVPCRLEDSKGSTGTDSKMNTAAAQAHGLLGDVGLFKEARLAGHDPGQVNRFLGSCQIHGGASLAPDASLMHSPEKTAFVRVADASNSSPPKAIWTASDAGHADVDYFRESLSKNGINPDAPIHKKIGVYEPNGLVLESLTAEEAKTHLDHVRGTINDPQNGLSRNAPTEDIVDKQIKVDPSKYQNVPGGLKKFISAYAVASMDSLTKAVNEHVLKGNDGIFNVSQAVNPMILASDLKEELTQNPNKYGTFIKNILGKDKGSQLIAGIDRKQGELGAPAKETDTLGKELWTKIEKSTEQTLDHDQSFQQAMKRYRDAMHRAAQQGKFVVVGVGNFHMADVGERRPESEYNWYAMSKDVIAVGGTVWPSKSQDPTQHSVFFSSVGTREYHPTVVANSVAPSAPDMGTSFSAPRTATTIGMMLEQNPKLTFAQTKQILEKTAIPLPGLSRKEQGAGELQVDLAVMKARASAH